MKLFAKHIVSVVFLYMICDREHVHIDILHQEQSSMTNKQKKKNFRVMRKATPMLKSSGASPTINATSGKQ